jgi:hypothetical protein
MLHSVSVAVVEAQSGEEAVKIVDGNRSLLKPLNEEFVSHRVQEKDLN